MGTPLIAGRDITWEDTYQKIPVAMISENFAKEYWHDARNALGKRIRVASTDDWREIVGVVGDVYERGVDQPAGSAVYWPVMMDRFEGQKEELRRGIAFAIRSPRAGSQAFLNEVRQTVWSSDPNIPLGERAHAWLFLYAVHGADFVYFGDAGSGGRRWRCCWGSWGFTE